MSQLIIRVENLSKHYRLGLISSGTLKEDVQRWWAKVRGQPDPLLKVGMEDHNNYKDGEIWALQDVSFEVREGEILGIIGYNGAGKSTLLKILSKITAPTSGVVKIRGRIGSLLEVGTGFHPELSGRENIYLNGAILGMRKWEIDRKFDEIVDFSEIEKFIDTPVKRYSSGMYVRLAFAVAAHLEPEILVIDEVLAVGDAIFQKKCLGKMGEVANVGRTVLFVSHNMVAIRNLCPRSICLDKGLLINNGDSSSVINNYLFNSNFFKNQTEVDLHKWLNRRGTGEVKIVYARMLDTQENPTNLFYRLGPMIIEFIIEGKCSSYLTYSAICMSKIDQVKILQLSSQDTPEFIAGAIDSKKNIRILIESLPLQCGEYEWALAIHTISMSAIDVVFEVLPFKVDDDLSTSKRSFKSTNVNGYCSLTAKWQFI